MEDGDELGKLLSEAWDKYRLTCLWNQRRPEGLQSAAAVVQALRSNGDMKAWRLANRIEDAIERRGHLVDPASSSTKLF